MSVLEEDFHIKMTLALENEVLFMCKLSRSVEKKGYHKSGRRFEAAEREVWEETHGIEMSGKGQKSCDFSD